MEKIGPENSNEAQQFIKAIGRGKGKIQVGDKKVKVAQLKNYETRMQVLGELFSKNADFLTQIDKAIQEKLNPETPKTLLSKIFSWLNPFAKGTNDRLSLIQVAIQNVKRSETKPSSASTSTSSTTSNTPTPLATSTESMSSAGIPPPPPPPPPMMTPEQLRKQKLESLLQALDVKETVRTDELQSLIKREEDKIKELQAKLQQLAQLTGSKLPDLEVKTNRLQAMISKLSAGNHVVEHIASGQEITLSAQQAQILVDKLNVQYRSLVSELEATKAKIQQLGKEDALVLTKKKSETRLDQLQALKRLLNPSKTPSPTPSEPPPNTAGKPPAALMNQLTENLATKNPTPFREKVAQATEEISQTALEARNAAEQAQEYPQIATIVAALAKQASDAENKARIAASRANTATGKDLLLILDEVKNLAIEADAAAKEAQKALSQAISDAKKDAAAVNFAGQIPPPPPPPPPPPLFTSATPRSKPTTPTTSSRTPSPSPVGKRPNLTQGVPRAYFDQLQKTLKNKPDEGLNKIVDDFEKFK